MQSCLIMGNCSPSMGATITSGRGRLPPLIIGRILLYHSLNWIWIELNGELFPCSLLAASFSINTLWIESFDDFNRSDYWSHPSFSINSVWIESWDDVNGIQGKSHFWLKPGRFTMSQRHTRDCLKHLSKAQHLDRFGRWHRFTMCQRQTQERILPPPAGN